MRLLRVYPAAWRARYGDELAALIEQVDGGARMSMRTRLDVVRAGVGERARVLGLNGAPPRERAREGSLLVLYAWMLFVLGGFGVQKASEHWQAVTPAGKQGLPTAAFDVLFVTAGVGSVLVLLGVVALLPRVVALIRAGGWPAIRRPIVRAVLWSALFVAAGAGTARWAHSLGSAQRNGSDPAYGVAFVALVLLFAVCLFAWAAAAAAVARRLTWPAGTLRLEVWLGVAVSAAMGVMTVAAVIWWSSLASVAPWFFDGHPVGSNASALDPQVIVAVALMVFATATGLIGSARAVRALATVRAA